METAPALRKIIHIDMDAYYASVEQLDRPELRGKPIAVGGSEQRGVVSAASYEARKFGVRSAMSGVLAKKNCPDLIFVRPRFDRYKEISLKIRQIFHQYTDQIEPLSLDEAYLDVTVNKKGHPSATLLAQAIRKDIYDKTGLTASAGISYNKFLAKMASDFHKPNGQKTITPEEALDFLAPMDLKKFYGIGKVTAERFYRLGLFTGADLRAQTPEFLTEHFGPSGAYFYDLARGIHHSPVQSRHKSKSMAAEHSFAENLTSEIFMLEQLERIARELAVRLKRKQLSGKTVTLKIKYSDFKLQTRSKTLPYFIADAALLLEVARELLFQEKMRESVRLLGLAVSHFPSDEQQKKATSAEQKPIAVQLKFDF